MKDSDFDAINKYLTEAATCSPKKEEKPTKLPKKMQKDELEDEEKEKEREVKNFKALDKIVTKLIEYLEKSGDEKALKAVKKIAEIVGTELEAHEEEKEED